MYEMFYRGKRKDTKQWIYSGSFGRALKDNLHAPEYFLGSGLPASTYYDVDGNIAYLQPQGGCLLYAILPGTLGRFIGEHDKDGRMIFEGDIYVAVTPRASTPNVGVVKYEGGGFYPFAIPGYECSLDPAECTIIGNIHDNPELIKGGNK